MEAQLPTAFEKVVGPPARPHHPQVQAGELVAKPRHDVERVLDALVRDEPGEHDEPWRLGGLGGIELGDGRSAVPGDGDVARLHTQPDQLAAGDLAHGDVRRPAVDTHRDLRLHEPAEPRQGAGQDRPLFSVHVVHQHHDARAGEQPGQERHAVLHLEDGVEAAEPTGGQEECGPQVDGQVPTPADVTDPVAGLGLRGSRITRGEHRESGAAGVEAPGDLGDVELRTAGLGVPRIAPVEHEDVVARSRHLAHPPRRPVWPRRPRLTSGRVFGRLREPHEARLATGGCVVGSPGGGTCGSPVGLAPGRVVRGSRSAPPGAGDGARLCPQLRHGVGARPHHAFRLPRPGRQPAPGRPVRRGGGGARLGRPRDGPAEDRAARLSGGWWAWRRPADARRPDGREDRRGHHLPVEPSGGGAPVDRSLAGAHRLGLPAVGAGAGPPLAVYAPVAADAAAGASCSAR